MQNMATFIVSGKDKVAEGEKQAPPRYSGSPPPPPPPQIAADDILIFYFYLSKEIRLDVSCKSSA